MFKEKKLVRRFLFISYACMSSKISVLIRIILYFINLIGRQYKNEQRTHGSSICSIPEVKLELSHFFVLFIFILQIDHRYNNFFYIFTHNYFMRLVSNKTYIHVNQFLITNRCFELKCFKENFLIEFLSCFHYINKFRI